METNPTRSEERREGTPHRHGEKSGANAGATSASQGTHDGVAMAQKSGLYYASSSAAASLSAAPTGRVAERELTPGVCYCCKTALAAGPDGALYAAWRHVYPGNLRDIAFSVSRDGGRSFSTPLRVSQDQWEISGCPDDGPAIAVDARGVVHVIWPTVIGGAEPQGALFYASTRDGRTFTPRVRVPTLGSPKPSHPQIAIDGNGRIAVAWDEVIDGTRVAAAREITATSKAVTFGEAVRLGEGVPALYPVLSATSRGWLAAWTSGPSGATTIAVTNLDLPAAVKTSF